MKAFVLAAGKGTRLRPFTDSLPKPMIPVLNRPVMGGVLSLCREHGFTEIMANVHYKGEQIMEVFGDGAAYGVQLSYSVEEHLLGTAGGVRRQIDFLQGGTFAIVSGDVVTDLDLSRLLAFHQARGAMVTMAVKDVDNPSRFGVVVTDETGRILSFQEKPAPGTELSRSANTGIYILEPEVLKYIPKDTIFDFGNDLFPMLLKLGVPLCAMSTEAYWSDVGTLPQYLATHWDLLSRHRLRRSIGKNSVIEPGAIISGDVMIGDNCHIQAGAVVTGLSCIGDGTTLVEGAHVSNSVIWSGAKGCRVDHPVISAVLGHDQHVVVKIPTELFSKGNLWTQAATA
jgi:mannose-1-phosphate guanylyltransferase